MTLAWAPVLVVLGAMTLLVSFLGPRSKAARAAAAAICVATAARYIWWRYEWSMPVGQSPVQQFWAYVFLTFESAAVISSAAVFVFMARFRDRTADADARQASPLHAAPTDIFIATYNEGYQILERTIIGAMAVEHPNKRVWVLDDGARDWVRDLAHELGAEYTCRVKGKHAKAGNVNNGLKVALGTGRRPDFVLLLDADFVASRTILARTLGLFEEPDVGIVQTPQHFFNPDPVQSNLLCAGAWPDEQRFFFNSLLPCKDAWGAAFCCGTSAVFRVAALEASGGLATETVTEDMLTSFKMEEYGYKTIFLNERLSLGLAPEGLTEYITQRSRWCLGAVQQIYTRWGFAGRARMRLVSRISSLDGFLFWSCTFPFKVMMISAPMIYWWTGTSVLSSTVDEMIYWLAPSVISGIVFMNVFTGSRVLPVMTDATQLLSAFTIIRTVAVALVQPFGHPFKVTAKGLSSEGTTVQWALMVPFLLMAAGTAGGMLANMGSYSPLNGGPGYAINVFWSVFNVAVLMITASVCVELPKRRVEERFATHEPGTLTVGGGVRFCTVTNISVGGCRLTLHGEGHGEGQGEGEGRLAAGTLLLAGGTLRLPYQVVFSDGRVAALRFTLDTTSRRALIRRLFTGAYANEVEAVRVGAIGLAIVRKVLG